MNSHRLRSRSSGPKPCDCAEGSRALLPGRSQAQDRRDAEAPRREPRLTMAKATSGTPMMLENFAAKIAVLTVGLWFCVHVGIPTRRPVSPERPLHQFLPTPRHGQISL